MSNHNNNNNNGGARRDHGAGAGGRPTTPTPNISPEVVAYLQTALQQQQEQLLAAQERMMARFEARMARTAEAAAATAATAAQPRSPVEAMDTGGGRSGEKPSEQERAVAKLMLRTMEDFTGKDRRPHALYTFLDNFENYADLMKFHGRQKALAFASLLKEDAAVWYRSLGKLLTWKDFKEEFLHRFRDPQAEANARAKLHRLKQTGSAKKYTEEFKRLAACLSEMTEADRFQTYLNGLRANLRTSLQLVEVKTFEAAIRKAEEMDDILFQEKLRAAEEHRQSPKERVAVVTEKLRDRKPDQSKKKQDDPKTKELRELRKKGACFHCKKVGHLQADCPEKTKK